ncbi:MAG: 6-phosphofructokinase, partial [Candidatus Dadabacteria bacterium]
VSRIQSLGGSVLGTSRFNPFTHRRALENFTNFLKNFSVSALIVVGGDGSLHISYQIAKTFQDIKTIHIPKSIDNDLPLPNSIPSFGFETAREVGTKITDSLMADAQTCGRWYLGITMGRQAGFLALGLGVASGATLTLIPEEFKDKSHSPREIASIIVGSIKKRCAAGKKYGVALIAEGILDKLDPSSSALLEKCPRDELGRITYSELELGEILLPEIKNQLTDLGISLTVRKKNIGYELRCANPLSFDREYCRFLGYGAIELLERGVKNCIVIRDHQSLSFLPFEEIFKSDGKVRSRVVNLESSFYKMARSFMIRDD